MHNKITQLLKKYKSTIMYLIFGFLTMVISVATFAIFIQIGFDEHMSNILSWIIAVIFAFVTNKIFVFEDKEKEFKIVVNQIIKFFFSRLFTLFLEEAIIYVFVTRLNYGAIFIKLIAQIIVIILNYILSKKIAFNNKK
ncbi:MAG: GtrA family protein [Ruminococcaceae bacterium]|nr:GtrA family protein [Oscillospiraceae bacterium]